MEQKEQSKTKQNKAKQKHVFACIEWFVEIWTKRQTVERIWPWLPISNDIQIWNAIVITSFSHRNQFEYDYRENAFEVYPMDECVFHNLHRIQSEMEEMEKSASSLLFCPTVWFVTNQVIGNIIVVIAFWWARVRLIAARPHQSMNVNMQIDEKRKSGYTQHLSMCLCIEKT